MLYGIRSADQRALAADGCVMRVLVSYGTHWFPWYVRRLAERPANGWFVLRNLVGHEDPPDGARGHHRRLPHHPPAPQHRAADRQTGPAGPGGAEREAVRFRVA